jgi:hypothetical protein
MKKVFKKEDMLIVPRWTDNIKDEWINPLILQGCENGFRDPVSSDLYDKISNEVVRILSGETGDIWNESAQYFVGDYCLYEEVYYKCINDSTGSPNPTEQPEKFEVSELLTFWYSYMKPYLIYYTYKSFLIWHGKHISQGGIRKHNDNTSFEINSDELGYLLGEVKSTISTKQTKMLNKLTFVDYTFDGIQYSKNDNVKSVQKGFKIFDV